MPNPRKSTSPLGSVAAAAQTHPPGASSRTAILEAATAEFIEHGYAGVRMEHVAKRAGYNKALIYKHFKDRAGLFEAVLEAALAGRRVVLEREPRDIGDAMTAWSDAAFAAPGYGKLLMREAMEHAGAAPVHADQRAEYYTRQIAGVAQAQSLGRLPAGVEPRFLFLALMSIVTLPSLLPQVTALVAGEDASGPNFQAGWRRFLTDFANALASKSEGAQDDE